MADAWWVNNDEDGWTASDAADTLLTYAIAVAERGPDQVTLNDYQATHERLFRDAVARRAADKLLARCKTPDLLWGHLRSVATGPGSWQLRRNAAHALIDPVLEALHDQMESPADHLVTGATARLDAESVREAWSRALERRDAHPEGAITMARTLLESTLKTILDDREITYKDDGDLPALYKAVSGELGLAPGAYSEQAFKQILGGCHSVVVGLGSLRNKVGDAHGSGRRTYRPAARHAALAVNLAGSMSLFLIETHEARD
jgi:Abortive infection C-terminus